MTDGERRVSFLRHWGRSSLDHGCCSLDMVAFSHLADWTWGWKVPSFFSTPFSGVWNWTLSQADDLSRWWKNAALSRIFLFLSSFNRTHKQALKFPFGQILLEDSGRYYSEIYFVRSKAVYNGASHPVGSQDVFLLNKWMSECQVLLTMRNPICYWKYDSLKEKKFHF